jgi:hypothetical protein
MSLGIAGGSALADDLAAVAQRKGLAVAAAEGAEVDYDGFRRRSVAPHDDSEENCKRGE